MATISLNGTTFGPSTIAVEIEKIGTEQVGADGTRNWMQRLDGSSQPIHKRTWTLTWEKVLAALRTSIRSVFLLATTFTYIDEDGTSYTVQCEKQDYKDTIAFISASGTLYYNVTLTIRQT